MKKMEPGSSQQHPVSLFLRKAIETPSLEIFKAQVDTVLDSLL